jgi:intracellular sulfur oxidation DsrE/DsrF family protein
MSKHETTRRTFLGTAVAAAAGAAVPAELQGGTAARQEGPDAWIGEVRGEHRCFFDFPAHKNGMPLLHILNYIGTYGRAYGTAAGQVGAVGTFYSIGAQSSIAMGFDDAMWDKYGLGEYLGLRGAGGRPYRRNVFHRPTAADAHLISDAAQIPPLAMFGEAIVAMGIESLQGMGTKFIMCENALNAWSFELEARGKGAQPEIVAELQDHLLPGVTIVPAMVIAIDQAQQAGMSYNKQ